MALLNARIVLLANSRIDALRMAAFSLARSPTPATVEN